MEAKFPMQVLQTVVDPEVIDFGIGNPPPSLLPLDRLHRAAEAQFDRRGRDFLQYGAERGDGHLRLGLARFLERQQRLPVDPHELLITNGASQGLDLVCTLFTRPGDTVFVEEPSYFLALRILADHGLRLVGIPVDEDGMDIAALQEALSRHRPVFLYTIPVFQNPAGVTLSQERRLRLLDLSREFGFLLVADEVYHLLSHGSSPPPPLSAYATRGNVISLGSFSKILAPGLRLGWMQTGDALGQRIAGCGLLDSGGGLNPFTSAIVRWVLEIGELDENLANLRSTYSARAAALNAALRLHLPQLTYHLSRGGYFFWARLPGGSDAEVFLAHAARFKVGFRPGVRFSSSGGLRDHLRLCFAYYDENELAEGAARLKNALAE